MALEGIRAEGAAAQLAGHEGQLQVEFGCVVGCSSDGFGMKLGLRSCASNYAVDQACMQLHAVLQSCMHLSCRRAMAVSAGCASSCSEPSMEDCLLCAPGPNTRTLPRRKHRRRPGLLEGDRPALPVAGEQGGARVLVPPFLDRSLSTSLRIWECVSAGSDYRTAAHTDNTCMIWVGLPYLRRDNASSSGWLVSDLVHPSDI